MEIPVSKLDPHSKEPLEYFSETIYATHQPATIKKNGEYHECYRLRITSHRLIWNTNGKYFELLHSSIKAVVHERPFFGKPKTVVNFGYDHISVRCSDPSTTLQFHDELQRVIAKCEWTKHPLELRQTVGLAAAMQRQEAAMQRRQDNMGMVASSGSDLQSLRSAASSLVQDLRKAIQEMRAADPTQQEASELSSLLQQFGLSYLDRPSNAQQSPDRAEVGNDPLEREVSSLCSRVLLNQSESERAQDVPLLSSISLPDLFCLVNRMRGAQLTTPDDFMGACQRLSNNPKSTFRLRTLADGTKIMEAALSPQDTQRLFLSIVRLCVAPEANKDVPYGHLRGVSAAEVAMKWHRSLPVVQEVMDRAVSEGWLCLDESKEGLLLWPNLFAPKPQRGAILEAIERQREKVGAPGTKTRRANEKT